MQNSQSTLMRSAPEDSADLAPVDSAIILRGEVRPDLQRDELLCEIFAATFRTSPDAVAMITMAGKLTYADVDARAEAIARGLVRRGVRPGQVLGLWMARGH